MGEAEKLLPLRVTVWTASSRQLTPLCSIGSRSMAWSRNNRMSLSISCCVMDNNRQEARKMEVSVAAAHGNLILLCLKHLKTTVHRLRIPEYCFRISASWTMYIIRIFLSFYTFTGWMLRQCLTIACYRYHLHYLQLFIQIIPIIRRCGNYSFEKFSLNMISPSINKTLNQ